MDNLRDTISASADTQHAFPFVLVDKFEVHGEHARDRTRMESITYAPLVSTTQVLAWQNFSVDNQGWIEKSRATFLEHSQTTPVYLPGKVAPFIYRRFKGGFPEPIMTDRQDDESTIYAPIWHLSPPPFNPAIVNFDLFSHHQYLELLLHVIEHKRSAFSAVIDVEQALSLQVSDADHLLYHEQFIDVQAGTGYDRPHTTYMTPIFASRKSNEVSGVLFGVLAWDVFLADLLPEGVNGVIAVIHSSCGENSTYTYEINGAKVS